MCEYLKKVYDFEAKHFYMKCTHPDGEGWVNDVICNHCPVPEGREIADFEARCPHCKGWKNRIIISSLPILMMSNEVMVFECNTCKHHIPVAFRRELNIVKLEVEI